MNCRAGEFQSWRQWNLKCLFTMLISNLRKTEQTEVGGVVEAEGDSKCDQDLP